jgi:hypothetical protein
VVALVLTLGCGRNTKPRAYAVQAAASATLADRPPAVATVIPVVAIAPAPTVSSATPAELPTGALVTRLTVFGHLVPDAEKRDYWSVNVSQNLFAASRVGADARNMQFELNLEKLPSGIGKGNVTLIGILRIVAVPAAPAGEQSYGRATRTYLDVEAVLR